MQPEREGYRAASEYVVAEALAVSLDKSLEWAAGSSSGTWNLVWNSGRLYPEYQGPTVNGSDP